MARKRVMIHGRVQGVGFRYSAREAAWRLDLHGWVRNRSDGQRVEVLVEGVSHKAAKARGKVELGWEKPQAVTQLSGRTAGDLIVMFEADASLVGQIVPVVIDEAKPLTLFGRRVEAPAKV